MEYSEYFETKKRVSGEDFIVIKDGAPEALRDMIEAIHVEHFNGALPNDWIYQVISEAFDELSRDPLENINIESDCYNTDLLKWLYENGNIFAIGYCDQYTEELGPATDCIDLIRGGQHIAKEAIYYAVDTWLQDQKGVSDE